MSKERCPFCGDLLVTKEDKILGAHGSCYALEVCPESIGIYNDSDFEKYNN